jgi:hypothetical protein
MGLGLRAWTIVVAAMIEYRRSTSVSIHRHGKQGRGFQGASVVGFCPGRDRPATARLSPGRPIVQRRSKDWRSECRYSPMSTTPAQPSRPTQALNASDFTIPSDQALMFRVRQRLAARGLQLELRTEKHGWRWAITGQPPLTAHFFGSLHLALHHADAHTALRYKEPPLGGGHA